MWTIYDDKGVVEEGIDDEKEARSYLKTVEDIDGVYAMNDNGDVLEKHDGPVTTVAKVQDKL